MRLVLRRRGERRSGRRLAFSSDFAGGTVPLESRALTAPAFFRIGNWLVTAGADNVTATPGTVNASTQSSKTQTTNSQFGSFTYTGAPQVSNTANNPGGATGFTVGVAHSTSVSGVGNVNPGFSPFTTGSRAGVTSDTVDRFGNGVARYRLQDTAGGTGSYNVYGLLNVHYVHGRQLSGATLSLTSNQFDIQINAPITGGNTPAVTLWDHATGQTLDTNALLASGALTVSSTGFDLLYQQTVSVPINGEERIGYSSTHTEGLQMASGPEGSPRPDGYVSVASQSQFVWTFHVTTVV